MKSSDKATNLLIKEARDRGWTIKKGKNHVTLIPPDPGGMMVVTGSTPSDWRALQNTIARIRRSDPTFRRKT